jgi:hypothetical protein
VGITGNENAGTAAKEALNESIQSTKKYPLQDLTKWMERKQQKKSNNTTTEIKERKTHIRSNKDTQTMTRRDQVVISRLRTGGVPLIIVHILCQCKVPKEKMTRMNITKEVWKEERPGMQTCLAQLHLTLILVY